MAAVPGAEAELREQLARLPQRLDTKKGGPGRLAGPAAFAPGVVPQALALATREADRGSHAGVVGRPQATRGAVGFFGPDDVGPEPPAVLTRVLAGVGRANQHEVDPLVVNPRGISVFLAARHPVVTTGVRRLRPDVDEAGVLEVADALGV